MKTENETRLEKYCENNKEMNRIEQQLDSMENKFSSKAAKERDRLHDEHDKLRIENVNSQPK